MDHPRPNFHCNFRAPDSEWFLVWMEFKQATKALGLDICFVVLSLCRAWLKAQKDGYSSCQISSNSKALLLFQTNTFNYNVQKPRREKFQMNCSKNIKRCTLCSRAFQAYIVETAREIDQSFSFKDFSEIDHDFFRKLILELKKRHKILPLKPRSNPATYILAEWRLRYPTMCKNNIVKPNDTDNSSESLDGGNS